MGWKIALIAAWLLLLGSVLAMFGWYVLNDGPPWPYLGILLSGFAFAIYRGLKDDRPPDSN